MYITFNKYLISRLNWVVHHILYLTLSLITKVVSVSSSISSSLEFWSVNHTSIYKNSGLWGISSNWPNDLLVINVYKTLESYWKSLFAILQWTNTASVFRWGTQLYMSLFLLFHLSIHCALYLRNCTSCDHSFWYTCVKWWYLQLIFPFFLHIDFLVC